MLKISINRIPTFAANRIDKKKPAYQIDQYAGFSAIQCGRATKLQSWFSTIRCPQTCLRLDYDVDGANIAPATIILA